jgi:hypothetical protein
VNLFFDTGLVERPQSELTVGLSRRRSKLAVWYHSSPAKFGASADSLEKMMKGSRDFFRETFWEGKKRSGGPGNATQSASACLARRKPTLTGPDHPITTTARSRLS